MDDELLAPETAEGAGFEPVSVRQFTVFLENKVGRLQTLVRAIEEGAGRIAGLSIEESGDTGLVRLICAHPNYARELLQTGNFSFTETELLAVGLPPNTRQPLISICSALLTAEINIHYAYPLFFGKDDGSALALYADDPTLAAQVLIRKGFTLIGESDLAG